MRLLLRILRWFLIIVVVGLLVIGAGGYLWLRGALPQTSGTIKVQGSSAPIEIVRDADAVPHIRAQNEADALFGLGYVHAQDRLWQMEFQRRIGQGRLSEFAGPSQLTTDTFLRTLGAARAAKSAVAQLDPDTRALLDAYCAGVNAFISTHQGRELPVEFTILGIQPEPWRAEDVLVWAKMMAWNLGGNWTHELLRSKLLATLRPEQVSQILPEYLPNGTLILPNGVESVAGRVPQAPRAAVPYRHIPVEAAGLLQIDRTLREDFGLGGTAVGSNNWVVSGARTTTGKPLLANDPHLGAQIPSIWYLAHITGGRIDAIGATLPGLPAVVIGHNQRIAWGVTNMNTDVQDLYVERINDLDQAEYNGNWEPMQIIPEVVKVRGQPDVTVKVRVTRHGPLISDAMTDAGSTLSLRWTALDEVDHTIDAFLGLNLAQNWDDFTGALAKYVAPMQNFVYADVDGNIGYYAPGKMPIRRSGDGTLPAEGWTDAQDWEGYVPFEQLPHAFNPPEGYIVSANNKVAPDTYPYPISHEWAAPYRAARITELIEAKPKLSPDDIAAMQADQRSSFAREMLPYLLRANVTDERAKQAIAMLQDWDGAMAGDSAQAAIYEAWYQAIQPRIFEDELGDALWRSYVDERNFIAMAQSILLQDNNNIWCDDTRTAPQEDCPSTLGAALSDGLDTMERVQGSPDLKTWRWDRAHLTMFPHNVFDGIGPLQPIFSRSIPNGGDDFTVNLGAISRFGPYRQYFISSYRHIVDLGDLNASRYIHPVGQSGYVLSSNYDNFIDRWAAVEYVPMRYSGELNDPASERLVLEP